MEYIMSGLVRKNAVARIAAREANLETFTPVNVADIYGENTFSLSKMKNKCGYLKD